MTLGKSFSVVARYGATTFFVDTPADHRQGERLVALPAKIWT
jgi:hypothetical protein